jgi:type IV secretory pathway ATPase VirB11/archaellum biosynthesis ATPase
MEGSLTRALIGLTAKRVRRSAPIPLLVELFSRPPRGEEAAYRHFPFSYYLSRSEVGWQYAISFDLPESITGDLRRVVREVAEGLDPSQVVPITFGRLLEVLSQMAAGRLGGMGDATRIRELGELVAFEAVGLSRILALAKDDLVTEFFVDSDASPLYLDHSKAGRCETGMMLTERERRAIETHMDTFRGYTLDYATPSLKNDLEVAGARLRVSLDLDPISVNRFSLDVRRLNTSTFSLRELTTMNVLSDEAAAFLVVWLESGGNVTIIGETGTGKTTLMNALDEEVNPRLRRVYIEDAVETRDLLDRGYHQMKIKVDPFERGTGQSHSKETEIVKVLHRSPDFVVLSEIQSEEHSRAFYHALSAGVRGMQTFHASSVEAAVRRWTNIHGIPEQELLELGLIVQMVRPERLGPVRFVSRICVIVSDSGEPRVRDVYTRDRQSQLRRVAEFDRTNPPGHDGVDGFERRVLELQQRLRG